MHASMHDGDVPWHRHSSVCLPMHVRLLCVDSEDDFDAGSLSSRLKVEVSERTLTVRVDPKNTKAWMDCAQVITPADGQ